MGGFEKRKTAGDDCSDFQSKNGIVLCILELFK